MNSASLTAATRFFCSLNENKNEKIFAAAHFSRGQ